MKMDVVRQSCRSKFVESNSANRRALIDSDPRGGGNGQWANEFVLLSREGGFFDR